MKSSEYKTRMLRETMPAGVDFKKPVIANATRWWGKFKMLERFLYLKQGITKMVQHSEVLEMVRGRAGSKEFLSKLFWRQVECLEEIFRVLNKLSVKSQAERTETRSRIVSWIHETH